MKYVYDAQAVIALLLGLIVIVLVIKVFFLDKRKKPER